MAFFSSSLLSSPPLRCCCYLRSLPPRSRYLLTPRRASLRRSRLSLSKARSWRCRASSSGPPPPLGNDPDGLQTTLSKIQDRVQIFLAVLFWMSLFFWGSAWDGRDNSRNKKGPRFRK